MPQAMVLPEYEANLPICWVSLGRGEDWIGGECCLRLLCVSTRCSVGIRLFAWCLAGLLLCLSAVMLGMWGIVVVVVRVGPQLAPAEGDLCTPG